AGLFDLLAKLPALSLAPHGRATAGWPPDRRRNRSYNKAVRRDLVRQPLEVVIRGVDADVRVVQKQVDSVEPDAVDRCRRGQFQHRVEVDEWFGAGRAFSDDPRPDRVVQLRERIGHKEILIELRETLRATHDSPPKPTAARSTPTAQR